MYTLYSFRPMYRVLLSFFLELLNIFTICASFLHSCIRSWELWQCMLPRLTGGGTKPKCQSYVQKNQPLRRYKWGISLFEVVSPFLSIMDNAPLRWPTGKGILGYTWRSFFSHRTTHLPLLSQAEAIKGVHTPLGLRSEPWANRIPRNISGSCYTPRCTVLEVSPRPKWRSDGLQSLLTSSDTASRNLSPCSFTFRSTPVHETSLLVTFNTLTVLTTKYSTGFTDVYSPISSSQQEQGSLKWLRSGSAPLGSPDHVGQACSDAGNARKSHENISDAAFYVLYMEELDKSLLEERSGLLIESKWALDEQIKSDVYTASKFQKDTQRCFVYQEMQENLIFTPESYSPHP